jgi:hypothetical protein
VYRAQTRSDAAGQTGWLGGRPLPAASVMVRSVEPADPQATSAFAHLCRWHANAQPKMRRRARVGYTIVGGHSAGSGHGLPRLFRQYQQGQLCEAGPWLTARQGVAKARGQLFRHPLLQSRVSTRPSQRSTRISCRTTTREELSGVLGKLKTGIQDDRPNPAQAAFHHKPLRHRC